MTTPQDRPFVARRNLGLMIRPEQGLKEGWAGPTPWDYRWEIARSLVGAVLVIAGTIAMMVSVPGRDMYLLVWGIAMTYFGSKL